MRAFVMRRPPLVLEAMLALILLAPSVAVCAPMVADASSVDDSTWVDHDGIPIPQPPDREESFWGHGFRQVIVEPLSHAFDIPDKVLGMTKLFGARPQREAANVNAFDEAPNSAWFTNRNHVRAVPVSELARGPYAVRLPPKPWTIHHMKHGGTSLGFQIKDADGEKWLVKIDPRGYTQLSGGADMVARTLLHAAGYNVPHNEMVRFARGDISIAPDLLKGTKGEHLTDADLDSMLARCATFSPGIYSAFASEFLPGHALGAPNMNQRRTGDHNDWYTPASRRDMRGLYVVCSWIGYWDTKDSNFLDTFTETRDSLGHVNHYILDAGSSLGANSTGPKNLTAGFEHDFDLAWIARRVVTLGFVVEPWRRARQESGIPSVGNFESAVFAPGTFRTELPQPAFLKMTDRDAYWGAKIVASFSDAQIAAAVDAAHYEDPRAPAFLVQRLIERRDKIARYWFDRVAPLDFFEVRDGALRFHDLAVDIGLAPARGYEVVIDAEGGQDAPRRRVHMDTALLPLAGLADGASQLSLDLSVTGSDAGPARIELTRRGPEWVVTRVRHG